MSMTSQDVGNHAPGHMITHKGREYRLRFLDDKLLASFERQKFAMERERLRSRKEMILEDLGAAAYEKMLQEVWDKYNRHEYSFFGSLPLDAKNLETVTLLLSLMLDCPKEEVLELFLAHQQEITDLLKLVIQESVPTSPEGSAAAENPSKNP